MTTEKAPALASAEEAREILGAEAFAEAVEDGTVRRVQSEDGTRYVGADVDKVARESDPHYLARLVRGEVHEDDDDQDGPRAMAARVPRL